jgi:poly(3-hydroxybutyrate) depolymerase
MARRDYTHGGRGAGASAKQLAGPAILLLFADGGAIVTYPSGYARSWSSERAARQDLNTRGYINVRVINYRKD